MRPSIVLLASVYLTTGCSSDPLFTDEPGTGAGGEGGTDASGGESTGASSSGGAGAASSGGGGMGGTSSGGSPPVGGGGAGGAPMPFCGDGIINGTDECDDGNPTDDDGCTGCVVDCPAEGIKDPATSHCYFILEGFTGPWQDAIDECANVTPGTTLAVLATIEEFELVVDHYNINTGHWIGGHDMNVEDSFEWFNGEPWTYVNFQYPWDPTQPSDFTAEPEHCVLIGSAASNETLYDRVCDDNYSAICERAPVGQ